MMSYQKRIAGLVLSAVMAISLPMPSLAVSTPSAQTILKQSFANLERATSYDVSGSIGMILPAAVRSELVTNDFAPYLVGGKEFRGYFDGSVNKKTDTYQFSVTSYNSQTGESPRIDIIGSRKGSAHFRVGGVSLAGFGIATSSPVRTYLDSWIRIDTQSLAGMTSPMLMPVLGTESQMVYPTNAQVTSSTQTMSTESVEMTPAEKKKLEALAAKIQKAFWSRNVIVARRLADAKDHTGAAAYRLSLKLNPIGARLFVLDVARIAGEKPSVSDLKELNKIFSRLPVFSGDLIVRKSTLLPEVMSVSVSGFEKKKSDDSSVQLKVSFEHVGSGREIMMPTEYKKIEDIIKEIDSSSPTTTTTLLTEQQARDFAVQQAVCTKQGAIKSATGYYNPISKTWWFDMENMSAPSCAPACVVSETSKNSEINWRCTGALQ